MIQIKWVKKEMKKKRGKKDIIGKIQIITEKVTTKEITVAKDTTVGLKVRTTLDKGTTNAIEEKKATIISKKGNLKEEQVDIVVAAIRVKKVDTEKSLADIETREEGQMKVIIQIGGQDRHICADTPI